jgi:hypothetical protein
MTKSGRGRIGGGQDGGDQGGGVVGVGGCGAGRDGGSGDNSTDTNDDNNNSNDNKDDKDNNDSSSSGDDSTAPAAMILRRWRVRATGSQSLIAYMSLWRHHHHCHDARLVQPGPAQQQRYHVVLGQELSTRELGWPARRR